MKRYGESFVTRRHTTPTLPWRRRAVLRVPRELESVTSWRLRTMREARNTVAFVCRAIGGTCEWPNTCDEHGGCAQAQQDEIRATGEPEFSAYENERPVASGVSATPARERAVPVRMKFAVRCTRNCATANDCDNSCRIAGVKGGGNA